MTPLLAQRLRADRSFEKLYERYVGDVYRYSLAVLNNAADAEDVTQTTFLNAYRAIQRGERPEKPQHWLIKIAHNVCRQRFRQSARRPDEVMLDENIGDATVADEAGPTAEDIRRAMGHLAFNQRAALVMRELEGRSYAEIAETLGVTVSAVETLIFRARRALREQLEGRLTCAEAERAISKQIDGELGRSERGALRGHLRECPECATLARKQRAQRVAIKALGLVPLPQGLTALLGGGGAAAGATVGAKAAAVLATAVIATGASVEGAKLVRSDADPRRAAAPAAEVAAAPRPDSTIETTLFPSAMPPANKPAIAPAETGGDEASESAKSERTPNLGRREDTPAAERAQGPRTAAERAEAKAQRAATQAAKRAEQTTRKRERKVAAGRARRPDGERGSRADTRPQPMRPEPRRRETPPAAERTAPPAPAQLQPEESPALPPVVAEVRKTVDDVTAKVPKETKK